MNINLLYYDVERVPVCSKPLTYNEVLKINKKAISERAYSLVMTLQSLPRFVNLIKKIRTENLHTSEKGFEWEILQKSLSENNISNFLIFIRAYDGYVEDSASAAITGVKFRGVKLINIADSGNTDANETDGNMNSLETFFSNLELGIKRIYQEFDLPDSIKEPLKLIILYNSILVPFSGQLDRYYVSDRDLRIVELKKTMKHKDIAEFFAQETDDYSINEDQIKNAYNIAVDKIALLQKGKTDTL